MEVHIGNAARLFFPNPSFEMVYYEAVRNSIDANAHRIDIKINIKSYSEPKSLKIEITDNGEGFTAKNFDKFNTLLEVEEEGHKGLGRLVYLVYFNSVDVSSVYEENESRQKRKFIFNGAFVGKNQVIETSNAEKRETVLTFRSFKLQKIHSYDCIKADSIKKALLLEFYPLFYRLKKEGKKLDIQIAVHTDTPNSAYTFHSDVQLIDINELPVLEEMELKHDLDLYTELKIFYSITPKSPNLKSSIITSICVDERTIPIEIISKKGIPDGYDIIFILYSNFFTGQVDTSRQRLTIDDVTLKRIEKIFGEKVAEILNEKIPQIQTINKDINKELSTMYPHLQGLFEENPVGIIDKEHSLEVAERKFFSAQKEILEAEELTEEQYLKTLEISSRLLTEYILYRNFIINKLKEFTPSHTESDLHNLIIPMKRVFKKSGFMNDIYNNNAWLLDDKYMTYSTILSDRDIGELITHITKEELKDSSQRPDMAIVFSSDPNKEAKVDVVIVEFKRLGLELKRKTDIVVELEQRAKRLNELYPHKIQRIWYYGIIDIDMEFRLYLKGQRFNELFSNDTVLYATQDVYLTDDIKIPIGIYIQSFKSVIDDAESRNSTFLNILKEGFKK